MADIRIANITKEIKGKRILDDITLEIKDRSFTCILGPPGAGKTTLLRIIAGLETPEKGRIYFGEKDVTDLPPQKRGVSMVFQDFALYPHLTVYKNIASPLIAMKLPSNDIEKRVKEVAKFLKIDELLNRKPHEISGGEMQRVAIGRLLVKKPKICLFDEPLVNLDYKIREEVRGELKLMREKFDQTIIYATPDPVDALSMADKVAIINEGKIMQYDTVNEVYNHPINLFSGVYMGNPPMNTVDCSVVEKNGRIFLDASSFKINAISLPTDKLLSLDKVVLGIRPEDIQIGKNPSQGYFSLNVETIMGEVIGSDTILHVKIGEHSLRVFIPKIYREKMGKSIWISFNINSIYIFDKSSGKTIFRRRNG